MSKTNIKNRLVLTNTELNREIALLKETLLEKERTIEVLQGSEKQYRRLFESAKDGILILDADSGMVVDVNPFLIQLLGYSHEEFCGKHVWEISTFKDIAASKNAFKALQDNQYIRYEDLPLKTRSGQVVAVEFVSNVYLVAHSKVIQCTIRDITSHLRQAAQLQQAQKMEAVGVLAGGVAHDYNNMLSVILVYSELALNKMNPSEPLYNDLQEIFKAAERSKDITRQLLTFARKQTIIPVVLDLNRNVESMLKMLRRLIGEDIDLVWRPEIGMYPIKMDPVQVDQILANLCINSRDAIAGVGKVTIETGSAVFDETYCADHAGFVAGNYVLLAVSDDGCGMDKETLALIFEPFFTSKGIGQGTGLGLSTVYGIVKQNNGFINVYSEPGKGTTFRIYLPRYAGQTIDTPRERTAEIACSRGETVMVVEDEPALLKMSKRILEELGYRVLAADTPGKAIELTEEHASEINLIITDVVMPEMNGRDLVERFQSLYPSIKILFMSGYTADVIAHRGVLSEGVNFIQKPYSIKDLAVKVRKALEH